MIRSIISSVLLFIGITSYSQNADSYLTEWYLKDSSEGFRGISLDKAYQQLKGKKSNTIIVAVIDSGIDTAHQDLRPVLWANKNEIPGNNLDDDRNGYADDMHGWSFRSAVQYVFEEGSPNKNGCKFLLNKTLIGSNDLSKGISNHGTSVSGIIGAVRSNGIGIDGIADNVRIMTLRVVHERSMQDRDIAMAIRYAVDNGAKIINISLGVTHFNCRHVVDDAVKYAEKGNVLIIHAAGNEEVNIDKVENFPSPYYSDSSKASNWITVGASPYALSGSPKGPFSNWGKMRVDVFAPGIQLYTTIPDSKYDFFDGTSAAAPVVSGIAALVWSYFPKLTALQVKEIIEKSVIKTGHAARLSRFCRTGGIVNAYEAVKLAEKY